MATRRWSDLTTRQRVVAVVLGIIQLSLAGWAWSDLTRRPADQVNGPKRLWAGVIGINWVGPAAYAWKGRRPA